MARLDDTQLARKDALDAVRTAARLRMRIELRHALNTIENDVLDEFDRRVAAGQSYELDIRSVLDKVKVSFSE